MKRINFSDEQIRKMVRMYEEGKSIFNLANLYNVSCTTIQRRLGKRVKFRRSGWKNPLRIEFPEEKVREIIELYISNLKLSCKDIGKKFGISRSTVHRILVQNGVDIKKYIPYGKNRIRFFNERIFEGLDPKSAYVLGFVAADGNVDEKKNRLTITCGEKDKGHLEKIRDVFGADEKTKVSVYNNNRGFSSKFGVNYVINFISKDLVRDLGKYGICNKKSFDLKFPINLDKKLYPDFIRGIVDGDGSVGMYKTGSPFISIVGPYLFLTAIRNIFVNVVKVRKNKVKKNRTIFQISWSSKDAIRILRWLYKNPSIYLDRKYTTYLFIERNRMEEYIQKLHEVASKGYSNSVERDVFRKMVLGPEAMFGDRHTILFSTPSETR